MLALNVERLVGNSHRRSSPAFVSPSTLSPDSSTSESSIDCQRPSPPNYSKIELIMMRRNGEVSSTSDNLEEQTTATISTIHKIKKAAAVAENTKENDNDDHTNTKPWSPHTHDSKSMYKRSDEAEERKSDSFVKVESNKLYKSMNEEEECYGGIIEIKKERSPIRENEETLLDERCEDEEIEVGDDAESSATAAALAARDNLRTSGPFSLEKRPASDGQMSPSSSRASSEEIVVQKKIRIIESEYHNNSNNNNNNNFNSNKSSPGSEYGGGGGLSIMKPYLSSSSPYLCVPRVHKFSIENILKPEFGMNNKKSEKNYNKNPNKRLSISSNNSHKNGSSSSISSSHLSPGFLPDLKVDLSSNNSINSHISRPSSVKNHSEDSSDNSSCKSSRSCMTAEVVDEAKVNPPVPSGPLEFPAWVFCTRYSDRPSSGPRSRRIKKPEEIGKPKEQEEKRPRTAFTAEQLAKLKIEFDENRYLTEKRRQDLARDLKLNENQIKIWFQNKRAKLKKSSGTRNGLALQLMAQGLYNHSTVPIDEEEEMMLYNS